MPTPDHFIPLLYLAGLGAAPPAGARTCSSTGYAYGSLSMTAYTLDLPGPVTVENTPGSGALPDEFPPDGANI